MSVTELLASSYYVFKGRDKPSENGETAMATVVAQTRKLSMFFGRVAHRFDDARLASANREVESHKQFLGLMPF
jgi:hypothetical protein